jgi:hypothetical protein
MANYCWNWSCFTGDRANLEKLIANVNKAMELNAENRGVLWYGTYSVTLGLPSWQEGDEEYDVYDRYGSRWFECEVEDYKDHVIITGTSAWSPMLELFRKLSAIYELHVKAEYEEPGMDFAGYFGANCGDITEDRQLSYYQYRYQCDGLECIMNDIQDGSFDSAEQAINHFQELQRLMTDEQWEEFKSEVNSVFEDTKETKDHD